MPLIRPPLYTIMTEVEDQSLCFVKMARWEVVSQDALATVDLDAEDVCWSPVYFDLGESEIRAGMVWSEREDALAYMAVHFPDNHFAVIQVTADEDLVDLMEFYQERDVTCFAYNPPVEGGAVQVLKVEVDPRMLYVPGT